MAKFVAFLLAVFFSVGFLYTYRFPSVCDTPIAYKLGTVDSEFNLSKEEFLEDTKTATSAWDTIVGKPLFRYDPAAELTVNLVFDERQSLSNEVNNTAKDTLKNKKEIDVEFTQYEARSASFDRRLADLKSRIDSWNEKGGAPEDEYNKLKLEQEALETEAEELNATADRLNLNVGTYNAQVGKLNQTEDELEEVLQGKPEAGLYDPNNNKIDIYFNTGKGELIHTLEHEFGHALGLRHVSNAKAIMFEKSSQITQPAPEDKDQLFKLCTNKTVADRLQEILALYKINI